MSIDDLKRCADGELLIELGEIIDFLDDQATASWWHRNKYSQETLSKIRWAAKKYVIWNINKEWEKKQHEIKFKSI